MTRLELATEGPCKGHLCDNCRICRGGHCCRRDNPNYRLPEIGDWDGPTYGDLGKLNDDGAKVECHCCGEWFKALQSHIWNKHDLTNDEYRALFGLNRHRGLCSTAYSARLAASPQAQHLKALGKVTGRDVLAQITPEQRYASQHQSSRLEARNSVSVARGGRVTSKTCEVCGKVFSGYWVSRIRTCSSECAGVLRSANARRAGLGTTHRPPQAKLNMDKARAIRFAHDAGQSVQLLAREYGVSYRAVTHILRGETWKEGSESKKTIGDREP